MNEKISSWSISGLSIYLLCCCTPSLTSHQNPKQHRPNVIFIAVDDLNDWVGCLEGHPQIKTPNIDRLASLGTLFTNAHTQSPICNPSRTSVLTGYRPSTTGIYGLSPWIREVDEWKETLTLPQYFSKNGYMTYASGKIFHGNFGYRNADIEFDSLGPQAGVKISPPQKLVGETPGGNNPWVDWGDFGLKDQDLQDWEVANWAVDLIKNPPTGPYFLGVGFFLPHVPLFAPETQFKMYPQDSIKMPPILPNDRADTPRASWYNHWDVPEPRWKWFEENQQDTLFVQAYLAAISFMDQQVGRVLDAINQYGNLENTIIVLWSDHGFHLGEKEISGKNTLWEPSTRVPLIFAGDAISSDQKTDEPVELLDIYPTLLELCGLPYKSDLEGHSLLPQLQDPNTPRKWPAITTNNWNNHAVRTKQWRYIKYADGSEELYDMKNDPNEWINLINEDKADYRLIADSLATWMPEKNHLPYPGNYQRILEYQGNKVFWQGDLIENDASIPGI